MTKIEKYRQVLEELALKTEQIEASLSRLQNNYTFLMIILHLLTLAIIVVGFRWWRKYRLLKNDLACALRAPDYANKQLLSTRENHRALFLKQREKFQFVSKTCEDLKTKNAELVTKNKTLEQQLDYARKMIAAETKAESTVITTKSTAVSESSESDDDRGNPIF